MYAAVFAGGSAALFTGLLDFAVLSRSQAPFTASIFVDRVTVIISLGLGLGVAVGALLAIRASKPALEGDEYDDEYDDEQEDDLDDGWRRWRPGGDPVDPGRRRRRQRCSNSELPADEAPSLNPIDGARPFFDEAGPGAPNGNEPPTTPDTPSPS